MKLQLPLNIHLILQYICISIVTKLMYIYKILQCDEDNFVEWETYAIYFNINNKLICIHHKITFIFVNI